MKRRVWLLLLVTFLGYPALAAESGLTLGSLIKGQAAQEFLEVDEAFVLDVAVTDPHTLDARIRIASGYYLYRDKTRFQLENAAQTALAAFMLPPGKVKKDPYFGNTEVYYDELALKLALRRAAPGATALTLRVDYQGCAEQGICYAPTTKKVSLQLPTTTAAFSPRQDFLWALAVAFGTGLLLTFTPCVLPMIPIVSTIVVGQGRKGVTKRQGGLLSLAYVLGTAVTYTAAGILAGATGDQLQAYFQNAWAIGLFSVLFALLALSMFGVFSLQMPAFIQSRLHERARRFQGGSYVGAFVLGLVSALIVGACVSPLLISVLGVALSSKDPLLGGALMFALALGMGSILIAVGVGAGALLPRPGPWMETVKRVFGVLLLAVAIYLLGSLPQVPVLILWSALLVISAVYLNATQGLAKDAGGWAYFVKGVGTFLFVWGVLALIGGFAGNRDILRPLPIPPWLMGGATTAPPGPAAPLELPFERLTSVRALDERLAAARASGKPAMVDFYASWCTDCLRMERATFADPRVRTALKDFVLLQPDVTDNSPETRALKRRLAIWGPPATVFFAATGDELTRLRFYGFKSTDEFLAILGQI